MSEKSPEIQEIQDYRSSEKNPLIIPPYHGVEPRIYERGYKDGHNDGKHAANIESDRSYQGPYNQGIKDGVFYSALALATVGTLSVAGYIATDIYQMQKAREEMEKTRSSLREMGNGRMIITSEDSEALDTERSDSFGAPDGMTDEVVSTSGHEEEENEFDLETENTTGDSTGDQEGTYGLGDDATDGEGEVIEDLTGELEELEASPHKDLSLIAHYFSLIFETFPENLEERDELARISNGLRDLSEEVGLIEEKIFTLERDGNHMLKDKMADDLEREKMEHIKTAQDLIKQGLKIEGGIMIDEHTYRFENDRIERENHTDVRPYGFNEALSNLGLRRKLYPKKVVVEQIVQKEVTVMEESDEYETVEDSNNHR